mgnify:CR=1 FL=1
MEYKDFELELIEDLNKLLEGDLCPSDICDTVFNYLYFTHNHKSFLEDYK